MHILEMNKNKKIVKFLYDNREYKEVKNNKN